MSAVSDPARGIGDEARILIGALFFRVLSALLAFLSNVTFPPFQDQRFSMLPERNEFWDTFARYDSGWYWGIAAQGYSFAEGGRTNLAFFPLYPLLMRAGGTALGGRQGDYYFAGIVVSWVAFAGAMVMLFKLARLDLDREPALRAVMYAAVFPFAYFFGVVYSESLFLLCLVTAAYAFRTKRWMLAALAGAAMTATRVTGVMAVPGLAWLAWRAAGADRGDRVRAALAVVACGAGIGAYSAFNYSLSGSPLSWYTSITYWGYEPGGNPVFMPVALLQALATRPYQFLLERMAPYDTLNLFAALGTLALVPLIWKRFGAGYALIIVASLAVPLSSGQFEGLGRYSSVQFPVALALASLRGDARHQVILAVFAMLYAICLALFVTVHPLF